VPRVAHLQSGHGLEDTALVQAGEKSVAGMDCSSTAAGAAQQRGGELGLACRYILAIVQGDHDGDVGGFCLGAFSRWFSPGGPRQVAQAAAQPSPVPAWIGVAWWK